MSLLGEHLRRTREQRGISILQAEMETRIRAAIIDALESGDYAQLPPEPFVRGLIRTYATYLGLDSEQVIALYTADRTPPPLPTSSPSPSTPTSPETTNTTETPSTPSNQVRKPVAIRVPSLRPPLPRPPMRKPNLPEPTTPPESLTAPEEITPTARAHITRRPAPLPIILAFAGGIILLCIVFALVIITQLAPYLPDLVGMSTSTPTRAVPTRTPTLRPDVLPTPIPTLGATVPPAPSVSTPTRTHTPRATSETNTLNLDVIQVTQPITLRVGIDGVLVFDGTLAPGATRAWSAKDSLYVSIENPRGATIELNGNSRWFAPRNFSETRALERYWNINERGTPIPMVPLTPAPIITPSAPRLIPTPTPSS
ncbi:MAG: helix-turn-helix domain-containing protein [Anaerolineae bacterium]|nr:helix-turn-helix domain-containing protein [Anaerolineae bacterium]